jgi:sulfate permease, SulP family
VRAVILNYSRLSIVYRTSDGNQTSSRVTRSANHERALVKLREHVYVIQLQGFIFFGTAYNLVAQVRNRLSDTDHPLLFVVFDFGRVSGVDSSAIWDPVDQVNPGSL